MSFDTNSPQEALTREGETSVVVRPQLDTIAPADLPTIQEVQTTSAFALRWPWEPKKVDGRVGAETAASVRSERQAENGGLVLDAEEALLESRDEALARVAVVIKSEIRRIAKHKNYIQMRKDVDAAHKNGEDRFIFNSAFIIGSPLTTQITLPHSEGLSNTLELADGSVVILDGSTAFLSIAPITTAMINALPEMKKLDELIDAAALTNHDVFVELRNLTPEEENRVDKERLSGNQILALNFVAQCSQAGHQRGDGDDNGT